ncbi:peritrophin-44 [Octopus bimaculoides]|uniref:Chitin-binding type-2 domain-containing protein n=1 Tax=Octopus bimaculoides TaxID=37653 RepID=A0A0L8IBE0_OCTBM|nr:peritrophin-44 [Octopus bimaculoides]|eukprot:XP_014779654.1 PREDICTED: peritrophin-44-like [Octopus bimaculoides]
MECQNKPDGNYPIPNQCKQYIQCLNGVAQINTCPPHQNYDPALHTCIPEVSYPCQITPTTPATNIKTPGHDISNFCKFRSDGLYDSPNACKEYIYCASGKANLMFCGQGLYFDPKLKYCFFKDQVQCIDSTVNPHNFCANKPDGFYAHPNECHKYYICSRGVTTKMTCLNGQIFENNHCQVSNKIC